MQREQQAAMLAIGGLSLALMAIVSAGVQQLALGLPGIVMLVMALIVMRFQALY